MTRDKIIEKLKICSEKADIHWYSIAHDVDEHADLAIDENDVFYFYGVKTPYVVEDFESIKWHYSDEYYDQQYVRIMFTNGDALYLGDEWCSCIYNGTEYEQDGNITDLYRNIQMEKRNKKA